MPTWKEIQQEKDEFWKKYPLISRSSSINYCWSCKCFSDTTQECLATSVRTKVSEDSIACKMLQLDEFRSWSYVQYLCELNLKHLYKDKNQKLKELLTQRNKQITKLKAQIKEVS